MRSTKRSKNRVLATAALLALLVTPILAGDGWYNIGRDDFNHDEGYGIATVWVEGNLYAMVWYYDLDDTQSYTPGDLRFRTVFFRK